MAGHINIMQINIGRSRAAYDLLQQTAKEKQIDIILISETNKTMAKKIGANSDKKQDTQIIIVNKNIKVEKFGKGNGFNWVELEDVLIFSCYVSPNVPDLMLENMLVDIDNLLQSKNKDIIITGDFNGKSHLWRERRSDVRGDQIEEWMAQNSMTICNICNMPTFVRDLSNSIIDITICSDRAARRIRKWSVLDDESLSLHRYISFTYDRDRNVKQGENAGKHGRIKIIYKDY